MRLGGGIVRAGMLFDVAGTAAVFAGCTDQFVADVKNRALLTMRSVIPGLWNPLAYIAGGGIALRWFRDQFYNALRGKPQALPTDLYDEMIAQRKISPLAQKDCSSLPTWVGASARQRRKCAAPGSASPGGTPRRILPARCWKGLLTNMLIIWASCAI